MEKKQERRRPNQEFRRRRVRQLQHRCSSARALRGGGCSSASHTDWARTLLHVSKKKSFHIIGTSLNSKTKLSVFPKKKKKQKKGSATHSLCRNGYNNTLIKLQEKNKPIILLLQLLIAHSV
ncbi:hypothetical protein M9H77_03877 [Catharanthus roseus]|uniref:Uncharacterized protein n=1 Tax=Catharanthus roseus TaxID=4058 RepID=A0ACC0CCY1_CATRO|nr:hypothetical protein M9H77_03877 [Catharanthus roseus]